MSPFPFVTFTIKNAPKCAIGFGLLTCENREQALVRAAVNGGNKGGDAARTCIQMITHKRFFQMGS